MSVFALICLDKKDHLALRIAHRAEHLVYAAGHMDRMRIAGPLLDSEGRLTGSLLLFEASDAREVEDFLQGDPYFKAGLFEFCEVREWGVSLGVERLL